jgi:shikimate kinase
MIVLLIGPHRSGKSTLAGAVCARIPGSQPFDLDEVVANAEASAVMDLCRSMGTAQFSRLCHQHVERISQTFGKVLCLIAVGAGAFLNSEVALSWLPGYHTVALLAPPEQLYKRADKGVFTTLQQYASSQFSEASMRVFNSAHFKIDVSSGRQRESEDTLLQHLLDIKEIRVHTD